MNRDHVDKILEALWENRATIFAKIRPKKLSAYNYTRKSLHKTNVAEDRQYQRTYIGYYNMGRRGPSWYASYFGLLEREKANKAVTFRTVLDALHACQGGRVEASFSSKLVATVLPDLPIYDSVVRRHLKILNPQGLDSADNAYKEICSFFREAQSSKRRADLEREFDQHLPDFSHFTPTKKLDIMLWQFRPWNSGSKS